MISVHFVAQKLGLFLSFLNVFLVTLAVSGTIPYDYNYTVALRLVIVLQDFCERLGKAESKRIKDQ